MTDCGGTDGPPAENGAGNEGNDDGTWFNFDFVSHNDNPGNARYKDSNDADNDESDGDGGTDNGDSGGLEAYLQFPLEYPLNSEASRALSELCEFLDEDEVDYLKHKTNIAAQAECLLRGINYYENWEKLQLYAAEHANKFFPKLIQHLRERLVKTQSVREFHIERKDDRQIYEFVRERYLRGQDKKIRSLISKMLKPLREEEKTTFFRPNPDWGSDMMVREKYLCKYSDYSYEIVREENLTNTSYSFFVVRHTRDGKTHEIVVRRQNCDNMEELEKQIKFLMNYWDKQHKK